MIEQKCKRTTKEGKETEEFFVGFRVYETIGIDAERWRMKNGCLEKNCKKCEHYEPYKDGFKCKMLDKQ